VEAKAADVAKDTEDFLKRIDETLGSGSGALTPEQKDLLGRGFVTSVEDMLDEHGGDDAKTKEALVREASSLSALAQKSNATVAEVKAAYEKLRGKLAPLVAGKSGA
jgi:hypothetical protein